MHGSLPLPNGAQRAWSAMTRASLIGTREFAEEGLVDGTGHELDPDGHPVGRESGGYCNRWKTENRAQPAVMSQSHGIGDNRTRHDVIRNDARLMIEGRIHQHVQLLIRHECQHNLSRLVL